MSAMRTETSDEEWHLPGRLFLILLVVTASALGLVLLSKQPTSLPPILFNVLADAGLGLFTGLATRFALRGRGWFVQGVTAAAASLLGLALLGFLTGWQHGIGPFIAGLVTVHWLDRWNIALQLPLDFRRGAMDMTDLMHAAIALDTSWIALRVWKRAPRPTSNPVPVASVPSVSPYDAPQPVRAHVTPVTPPIVTPPSTGSNARPRIKRRKSNTRPLVSRSAPLIRPMRAKPAKPAKPRGAGSRRHTQPAVRLAVHEEHRCPYCLEPVKRNDPRGSVECQVCHTLHHKDCWDITGSCQVPHLNT